LMGEFEFAKAIEAIFALVDQANKYMNDEKPWALFKAEQKSAGEIVLLTVLEILRRTALQLHPFTPELSNKIWQQLGYDGRIEDLNCEAFWQMIPAGQAIKNQGPVFMRIEEVEP